MLTTAGRLLFAGDGSGNLVAIRAATGKPLWHSRIGDGLERAADIHARRKAVRARRGRRRAVRVLAGGTTSNSGRRCTLTFWIG